MKRLIICLLIAILSLTVMSACGEDQPTPPTESYTVEISVTELTLDVYEKTLISAAVKDENGNVTDKKVVWSSSLSGVVSVEDGLVTAKSIGTAKISAKTEDGTAEAEISVTSVMRGFIPRLKLSEENALTLAVGSTFNLSPEVMFKGVKATDADTAFLYSVSDGAVASVSDGTITALKAGSATVTVTASWRGLGGADLVGSEDAAGLRITLNLTVVSVG